MSNRNEPTAEDRKAAECHVEGLASGGEPMTQDDFNVRVVEFLRWKAREAESAAADLEYEASRLTRTGQEEIAVMLLSRSAGYRAMCDALRCRATELEEVGRKNPHSRARGNVPPDIAAKYPALVRPDPTPEPECPSCGSKRVAILVRVPVFKCKPTALEAVEAAMQAEQSRKCTCGGDDLNGHDFGCPVSKPSQTGRSPADEDLDDVDD